MTPNDNDARIHLHRAENGSLLIGDARVPLDEVLEAYQSGKSVQAVIERYPKLNPAEVREAIAYHQNDPDDTMLNFQDQEASWRQHEL
jgi:uncharacterized protein (DUF433 family)